MYIKLASGVFKCFMQISVLPNFINNCVRNVHSLYNYLYKHLLAPAGTAYSVSNHLSI